MLMALGLSCCSAALVVLSPPRPTDSTTAAAIILKGLMTSSRTPAPRWRAANDMCITPAQKGATCSIHIVTQWRAAGSAPPEPARPGAPAAPSDLLISDGCDWSGVIAKLFAK